MSETPTPETDEINLLLEMLWEWFLEQRDAARRDRDEAREELTRVRKELVSANRGAETNAKVNQGLCARLAEAERERDEARRERDELLQRLSVLESRWRKERNKRSDGIRNEC
jgi:chromosome segregation ATPase